MSNGEPDFFCAKLHTGPSGSWQHNDSQFQARKILLESHVLVCGDDYLVSIFFRFA